MSVLPSSEYRSVGFDGTLVAADAAAPAAAASATAAAVAATA